MVRVFSWPFSSLAATDYRCPASIGMNNPCYRGFQGCLPPFHSCSRSEYEMKPLDSPSEHAQQKTTACMSNNRTALCYYVRVWNVSWMNPSARQTKWTRAASLLHPHSRLKLFKPSSFVFHDPHRSEPSHLLEELRELLAARDQSTIAADRRLQ